MVSFLERFDEYEKKGKKKNKGSEFVQDLSISSCTEHLPVVRIQKKKKRSRRGRRTSRLTILILSFGK
jgi:hypothetical protein